MTSQISSDKFVTLQARRLKKLVIDHPERITPGVEKQLLVLKTLISLGLSKMAGGKIKNRTEIDNDTDQTVWLDEIMQRMDKMVRVLGNPSPAKIRTKV